MHHFGSKRNLLFTDSKTCIFNLSKMIFHAEVELFYSWCLLRSLWVCRLPPSPDGRGWLCRSDSNLPHRPPLVLTSSLLRVFPLFVWLSLRRWLSCRMECRTWCPTLLCGMMWHYPICNVEWSWADAQKNNNQANVVCPEKQAGRLPAHLSDISSLLANGWNTVP